LLGWFAPQLARRIVLRHRQRRQAWLQSESFFFSRLRHAARCGDARGAYFALLDWLQRFELASPRPSAEAFETAAHDLTFAQEIGALEVHLFAPLQQASA